MTEHNVESTEDTTEMAPRIYEAGFLVSPTVSEEGVTVCVDDLKKLIMENGGLIISEEAPRMRDLAYTMERSIDAKIQRYKSGYFGWVKFELPQNAIIEIKKGIDADERFIRSLIIKTIREDTYVPKVYEDAAVSMEEESEISSDDDEDMTDEDEVIDTSIDALVKE